MQLYAVNIFLTDFQCSLKTLFCLLHELFNVAEIKPHTTLHYALFYMRRQQSEVFKTHMSASPPPGCVIISTVEMESRREYA